MAIDQFDRRDPTDDKAPTKGALEEAASLFDELRRHVDLEVQSQGGASVHFHVALTELDTRRAALEPRLAKRRENQAKPRKEP